MDRFRRKLRDEGGQCPAPVGIAGDRLTDKHSLIGQPAAQPVLRRGQVSVVKWIAELEIVAQTGIQQHRVAAAEVQRISVPQIPARSAIEDRGESTRDLKAWEPMPGQRRLLQGDVAGLLHFKPDPFPHHVAHDLPLVNARVLAALDAPIHGDALDEVGNEAAWRHMTYWCVIASNDRLIPAALQRRMASRMCANALEVNASHAVVVPRPGRLPRRSAMRSPTPSDRARP